MEIRMKYLLGLILLLQILSVAEFLIRSRRRLTISGKESVTLTKDDIIYPQYVRLFTIVNCKNVTFEMQLLALMPQLLQIVIDNSSVQIKKGHYPNATINVRNVVLSSNEIELLESDFLSQFTNLITLTLNHNRMPSNWTLHLSNFPNLENVYLLRNSDLDLKNAFGAGLPKLKNVKIEENKMDPIPPRLLANIPSLEEVFLSFSPKGTRIPNDLFTGSTNLKNLDIRNIEQLPEGLINSLSNLEEIHFENIDNLMPPNPFGGLDNLKTVSLKNVQVGDSSTKLLANLSALEEAKLDEIPTEKIPSGLFAGSMKLKRIDIISVQEVSSDLLSGVSNLEKIYLTDIYEEIPQNLFNGSTKLWKVWLENIHLGNSNTLLADMPSLTDVYINVIHSPTTPPKLFSGSTNLKKVSMFNLMELPKDLLLGLRDIESIIFSQINNPIPPNLLQGLTKLRSVWMDSLDLGDSSSKLLANLSSLEEVTLLRIRSKTIPSELFAGSTKMKKLEISYVREISPGLLNGLCNLEEVYLMNIDNRIPANLLEGLMKLKKLLIQWVPLDESHGKLLADLSSLVEMTLFLERTKKIPDGFFVTSTNLKKLKILEIEGLPSELLRTLINLEEILIAKIKNEIPSNLLQGLTKLKSFELREVEEFPAELLNGLINLESVTFLNVINKIPLNSFQGLTKLQKLWFQGSIVEGSFRELITKVGNSVLVVHNGIMQNNLKIRTR